MSTGAEDFKPNCNFDEAKDCQENNLLDSFLDIMNDKKRMLT